MSLKIMILGANGFIGTALTNAILKARDWDVYGIDLADNKLGALTQERPLPLRGRRHHDQ